MCGIAGIFEFGRGAVADARLLDRMTELIAHRGPDDSGLVLRGSVGLGHRRLSIIDLSAAGHQPMASEDGAVWITYNGECYNYGELARSQRARQLAVIVALAVVGDPNRAILARHRLMARRGQIDDREPTMAQPDAAAQHQPAIVRPAMGDQLGHAIEQPR